MSKTRQGSRKEGDDNYPTPEWAIERFLEEWEDLHSVGTRWLEPCAGDGVIVEVVDRFRDDIEWTCCDTRDVTTAMRRCGVSEGEIVIGDFFSLPDFVPDAGEHLWDVAIFNPPFRLTMEFVARALVLAPVVVCMQRINYCGSAERNDFFRGAMPDVYVIPDRVSYTGDGSTDSVENAWHVWGPHEPVSVGEMRVLKVTPQHIRSRDFDRSLVARSEISALDSLFGE